MEETRENEIFVYTDGAHRYLVLPCRKSDTGGYRYRMLAANQIPGLLGCSLRFIDGDSCLYYEITSKQNLADLYENSVIPGAVLKKLLSEMTDTEKSLEEYLLNAEDLILNPHYIYRDSSADRWDFIYCPDEKLRNGGDSLKDLAEFLAVHADTDDREAAGISYRLCTLAENPNYVLGNDIFDEDAFFDGERKAYGEKKENNDGAPKRLFRKKAMQPKIFFRSGAATMKHRTLVLVRKCAGVLKSTARMRKTERRRTLLPMHLCSSCLLPLSSGSVR